MNEETKEQRGALPRGFCDACMQTFNGRRLPLADGGALIGGFCEHHRCAGVIRHYADGTVGRWRLEVPATQDDLRELMMVIAAAVAGVVDGVEDLRQRRLAGLN